MEIKIQSKKTIVLIASVVVLFISLTIINNSVVACSKKYISGNLDSIPQTQAALVLGAKVYGNGAASDVLRDRLLCAIDLYRAGKVKKFLLSGDHGRQSYDEVNTMKNFLLSQNITKEDIFLDHAGFETYDSVYRAKTIFCIESMTVVTQAFHLNRAVYIGRKLGIETYGFKADRMTYVAIKWFKIRERLSRVKAFFKTLFNAKPKFLGEKIPITGDSSKSWD